ncbi:MAG: glycosyltransferase, partial [Desulfovibrio sp.]|nr:glycosyltransferase [Desulfovibrio sp.]
AVLDLLAPGLPLADYPPAPETGRPVFGMGESLAPHSGALAVVRAMAALWQREDLPPWEVRMFGAGPRFAEILHEAESLGVAGRLAILGEQPPEVLAQCSAWLAPGTSPEEVPQTLWAGTALGVPLICALSPLHRERLAGAPPHAALRIRESDPQALARAMIAVMRDERLRARLRRAGESLRPGIGLEAMAGRFVAFCGEVAAGVAHKIERPNGLARGTEQ